MSENNSIFTTYQTNLSSPEWFQNLQTEAWKTFQDLPLPALTHETWRFSDRKQADLSEFRAAINVIDESPSDEGESVEVEIPNAGEAAARFIFSNDDTVHAESELPEGVICLPLADALEQQSELVQQHLLKQPVKLGSEKFAALHTANLSNGLFVYVPKNVVVEKPIEAVHIASGEGIATFPHTLVVTEENAKVTVIDHFISSGEDAQLVVAMNDLSAGDNSSITYLTFQKLNLASKIVQIGSTQLHRDARAKSFVLNTGAKWLRNESYSTLSGKGAHSDMLSLSLPSGEQSYDQRTFQHHEVEHTYSDLLYKNTLYDKAKTVFSGLINVDTGAHYTDAYQTCRNLMMSDTAEAHSMPGLQIHADQVKCSHGSTSAAISDDEIFYLLARGIPASTARQLIAKGFCAEVVERLEDEALIELCLAQVDDHFKTLG